MRKTTGQYNVSNQFVDYNPPTVPNGTVADAAYLNDLQGDLISVQEYAGVAEGAYTTQNYLKSIRRIIKEESKHVGELFHLPDYRAPGSWNLSAPDDYFPAICLSAIDGSENISSTDWPDLVPYLRAQKLEYRVPGQAVVSSFAGTVTNAGEFELAENTVNNILLQRLSDYIDAGFSATVNGATISSVSVSVRAIQLSAGVLTTETSIEIYPYRTASTTTARLYQVSGRALMSAGDSERYGFANLMLPDQLQGFQVGVEESLDGVTGPYYGKAGSDGTAAAVTTTGSSVHVGYSKLPASQGVDHRIQPVNDGTNGDPRQGTTTEPRSLSAHLYIHGGRYLG